MTKEASAPVSLVLRGGRVFDPESGFDMVADVAIAGDQIADVQVTIRADVPSVDVSGMMVVPGFIDLHSHALNPASMRLQALDGVTTALELECGARSLGQVFKGPRDEGRPLNYGYAASWSLSRMSVLGGVDVRGSFEAQSDHAARLPWQEPTDAEGIGAILKDIEGDLRLGALGIGVLLGYAPRSSRAEFHALAELAAAEGVPLFVHARYKNATGQDDTAIDAVTELVTVAAKTGAHVHVCHLNSVGLGQIGSVRRVLDPALESARVTTEAYPYGAGMTYLSAPFLGPAELARVGIGPSQIEIADTGERPQSVERLLELRASSPAALAIVHYLDEANPSDWARIVESVLTRDAAIASDAIPFVMPDGRIVHDDWPIPAEARSHPRGAGTFARSIGQLSREEGVLSLTEMIRRCTIVPARILEASVPAMRRKGRLAPGADADILVFDPDSMRDQATYQEPSRPSVGVEHLFVNGQALVSSRTIQAIRPGRAVTRTPRTAP